MITQTGQNQGVGPFWLFAGGIQKARQGSTAHPTHPHLMSEHIAVLKIALRHHMPKGQDDEPNGDAAEQEPKLAMNQG